LQLLNAPLPCADVGWCSALKDDPKVTAAEREKVLEGCRQRRAKVQQRWEADLLRRQQQQL
jgi:hypothetical protein